MNKIIFLFVLLLVLLFVNVVNAQTHKQNLIIDIEIPYVVNGSAASSSALCNVSVKDPNSVFIFENKTATNRNNGIFNITLNSSQTSVLGEYKWTAFCCDGGKCSAGYDTFKVTPNGKETTEGLALFYLGGIGFMILLIVLFTYLFYKHDELWIKAFCFYVVWGVFLVINYMAWVGFTNYLYTISFLGIFFKWLFIIQMYASFPLVLGSFIFYSYVLIMNKQMKYMLEHGVPTDEAYERSVKGGVNYFRSGKYKKW